MLTTTELYEILKRCMWKPGFPEHDAVQDVVNKIASAIARKDIFFNRESFVLALGFQVKGSL